MRRPAAIAGAALLAGAALAASTYGVAGLQDRQQDVPVAKVVRGPLKLTVHAAGELRATRTVTLSAPPIGGMLRLVELVQSGTPVTAGQVVFEFDAAEQQFALEQARSELDEAEQEILKMRADADVQAAQDQVALLTARFDVRRAELDALGNEFVGAIDAKKNMLSLEEARRRLAQLDEDVRSRAATSQAALAVVEERRNKARLAMQRALQSIDSLVVRAPMDGVVAVRENRDAAGGFMFFGMVLPEYREGDTVWPGRPVADLVEDGRMELRGRVNEVDRANLAEGQSATAVIDMLPGVRLPARVGTLGGLPARGWLLESTANRQFDVTFHFDAIDSRLRPGASARIVIDGQELSDVLHVPRQAVFEKAGQTFVYVRTGPRRRFEPQDVVVEHRTEGRVAISGVPEDTEVALVDPHAGGPGAEAAPGAPVPAAGGVR